MHQTKKGKQWYFGMKAHIGGGQPDDADSFGGGHGGESESATGLGAVGLGGERWCHDIASTTGPVKCSIGMMGSTLFTALAVPQVGGAQSVLQVTATPWAIPTFTQQLDDPKQGINTPDIMKGFTVSAYQTGARQIMQAVDVLQQFRENPTTTGLDTEVKKFADMFKSFLIQVQEMKWLVLLRQKE